MTANEARMLTEDNQYRMDAVEYGIFCTEEKIRKAATGGEKSCLINFWYYPNGYLKFEEKYGPDTRTHYKQYDVESELREYFTKNGFKFRYVTDLVLGGVRQDPFWEICW